ncbi:MAG: cyclophilin-like fold protein [Bacteroides sp.]|nr:cyclophilin-like fold protein [Prevotella sp.]MCM1407824.1 cyclophilin-like fold protein [Treponema brennaborense]MCM1470877.1 cyclophilin-like fold protein [Bacteroides sp.]
MKKSLCIVSVFFLFAFFACANDAVQKDSAQKQKEDENMQFCFTIGNTQFAAELENNAATAALKEKLKTAPITINMSDYGGWEKVGSFGFSLPASDEQITAQPCDFVLYQGNQLVIFYGSNSWSYTRLGKIKAAAAELKAALGSGNVSVTLSLASAGGDSL